MLSCICYPTFHGGRGNSRSKTGFETHVKVKTVWNFLTVLRASHFGNTVGPPCLPGMLVQFVAQSQCIGVWCGGVLSVYLTETRPSVKVLDHRLSTLMKGFMLICGRGSSLIVYSVPTRLLSAKVADTCNPNNLAGWGRRSSSLSPAWVTWWLSKYQSQNKKWEKQEKKTKHGECNSVGRPWYNPQYQPPPPKKTELP